MYEENTFVSRLRFASILCAQKRRDKLKTIASRYLLLQHRITVTDQVSPPRENILRINADEVKLKNCLFLGLSVQINATNYESQAYLSLSVADDISQGIYSDIIKTHSRPPTPTQHTHISYKTKYNFTSYSRFSLVLCSLALSY